MSVVNVLEKISKSTVTFNGKQSTASRVFSVLCDSATEPEQNIRNAPLVPSKGTSWPGLPGLLCRSHSVRRDGSPYLWEVTATYSATGDRPEAFSDPASEPAAIEWSFQTSDQAIDVQPEDGKPIWNAAHERFDPPLKAKRSILVGKIGRNEMVFDALRAATFINTVNSGTFLGLGPKTALLVGISASRKSTPNLEYWRVSYEVHFNLATWRSRVANLGLRLRVLNDKGELMGYDLIKDPEGNPIRKPVPISADGTQRIDPDKKPIHWLEFDVYATSNFRLLGLE